MSSFLGLVGGVVSAYGTYQAGQAQQKAYDYNAALYEQAAVAEKKKATYEEEIARSRLKKLIGTQKALYAKAGVDISSGSPLLVMAETAGQGEKDIRMIRYGGDVKAVEQRNRATLARFYGSSASKLATISAAGQALSGAGNYYFQSQRT